MAYGARYVGTTDGKSNALTQAFIVKSGVTVTAKDFVYIVDDEGVVSSASIAGARLLGVAKSTVVGDGSATVLVITEPNALYLVDNDNDSETFAVTHVGRLFDLTGATGVQQVDTSAESQTGAQLFCHEYNPQIDPYKTDTSIGLYSIAEHAFQSTDA